MNSVGENGSLSMKSRVQGVSAYLKKDVRNLLFCKAYKQTGSLRGIAAEMGYISKPGVNGGVREMWKGTKGIPFKRLQALTKLARVTDEEVESNLIPKTESQLL